MKQIIMVRVKDEIEAVLICERIFRFTDNYSVWDLDEIKKANYNLKKLPEASKRFLKWIK